MLNKAYLLAITKVNGIGPIKQKKIIDYFHDPKDAWEASPKEWQEALGGFPKAVKEFTELRNKFDVLEYEASILKEGINYLTINDDAYPQTLREIYDAPMVLFYKGNLKKFSLNIAIVGSRASSYYGRQVAKKIAAQLSEKDINVVSGMARGIDSCAHIGALENNGFTTAVLGSGIDIIYPPENRKLSREIAARGLILSEYHPGTPPEASNFPARNRIISGISQGVVIIEAAKRSGSLITADFALEQGKEVFAVPGNISNQRSEGTNSLLKQGAKIVIDVNCILEEFNLNMQITNNADSVVEDSLTEKEILVIKNLDDEPVLLEELAQKTGLKTEELNSILTIMEINGLITQLPGKAFIRNSCLNS